MMYQNRIKTKCTKHSQYDTEECLEVNKVHMICFYFK